MKALRNSLQLIKMSVSVMKQDMRILVIQLLSLVSLMTLTIAVGYTLFISGYFESIDFEAEDPLANVNAVHTLTAFAVLYLTSMFIYYFSQAYISSLVLGIIRNKKISIAETTTHVKNNVAGLTQFTLLSSTVGVVLSALEDRLPWAGALAARIAHGSWNLATAFAVVSIVDGQAKTGIEATKKSVSLLISAFGENIVVRIGLGAIVGITVLVILGVFVLILPLVAVIYVDNILVAGSIAGFGILSLFLTLFLVSVLNSVITVMLYEYTIHGNDTSTIDKELFKQMVTPKKILGVFSHT